MRWIVHVDAVADCHEVWAIESPKMPTPDEAISIINSADARVEFIQQRVDGERNRRLLSITCEKHQFGEQFLFCPFCGDKLPEARG